MEAPTVYVEWSGLEFEFVPKSSVWYASVGIVSVGSAIAAFIAGNVLFGIILLLAGGTVSLVGSRRPATHIFKITSRGIHVGEQVFAYTNIVNFAIDDHHRSGAPTTLRFTLRQGLVQVLSVPLGQVDFRTVRTALKNQNVEEVEHLDTFTARVTDWLGIG